MGHDGFQGQRSSKGIAFLSMWSNLLFISVAWQWLIMLGDNYYVIMSYYLLILIKRFTNWICEKQNVDQYKTPALCVNHFCGLFPSNVCMSCETVSLYIIYNSKLYNFFLFGQPMSQ